MTVSAARLAEGAQERADKLSFFRDDRVARRPSKVAARRGSHSVLAVAALERIAEMR
jgi:hypothetical protein